MTPANTTFEVVGRKPQGRRSRSAPPWVWVVVKVGDKHQRATNELEFEEEKYAVSYCDALNSLHRAWARQDFQEAVRQELEERAHG